MNEQLLLKAKKILEEGGLVGIPTETVYGLAGNALNAQAVARIFEVKNRPAFDPLIVHCYSIDQVKKYVSAFPETAQKLAQSFWPGPLTLVLPKKDLIPDLVTSGLESVAVRIPKHPLTLQLLAMLDFPLAAPSANPFGYISPTTAQHVRQQLGDQIPLILDGGPCQTGIESTIVGFQKDKTFIYRLGGISLEEVEKIAGKTEIQIHSASHPHTPGMLKSHYAPKVPLKIVDIEVEGIWEELLKKHPAEKTGALFFRRKIPQIPAAQQIVLSEKGDFAEAARNLFAALRYLDALPLEVIYTELLPESSLGRAINDRLRRAASSGD